ncbi:MAG: hypothetical protein J2P57_18560 [Acidimicrobiaceae bacterium]|nr:hypothetical protein [Acidimicrobiaceae bacterium]
MADRVLSTPEAKQAIAQIQNILNGQFIGSIQQLENQGQTLSEPNVWDGNLAQQFRSDTWPQTSSALKNAHTQLIQLQQELNKIAENIFHAGGNA